MDSDNSAKERDNSRQPFQVQTGHFSPADLTTEDTLASIDKRQWLCIGYYLFVFTVIGIPIWLTTTSPLRSRLPDISSLKVHTEKIIHNVRVTIVTADSSHYDDNARKELRSQLISQWSQFNSTDRSLFFTLDWKVRPLFPEEEKKINGAGSLIELDKSLSQIQTHAIPGRIWIYLINSFSFLEPGKIKYGSFRLIYINGESFSLHSLSSIIISTVESIVDVNIIPKKPSTPSSSFVSTRSEPPIEPELDVWINIVIENSYDWHSFLDSSKYDEIKNLTKFIMNKSGIGSVVKVRLSSQIIHYALELDFMKNLSKNYKGQRLVDIKSVPHVINKIESRIPNTGSNAAFQINLIVPSSSSPPLYFSHSNGETSNLLLTAKTGFLVWNLKFDMNLGLKFFMRHLIGLNNEYFVDRTEYLITTSNLFCHWELDSISRIIVTKQIEKSLNSLSSVENLLGKVSNMVILGRVSEQMHLAVEMCHKSIYDLSIGRLETALTLSSRAYNLSQRSFFDPSLLSLLYFPDDQKYAVYCPLFLPVGIPLLTSLVQVFKWLRSKKLKSE